MGRGRGSRTAAPQPAPAEPRFVPSAAKEMDFETYRRDIISGRLLGGARVGTEMGTGGLSVVDDLPGRHEAALFLTPGGELVATFYVEETTLQRRRLLADKECLTGNFTVWELYRGKSLSAGLEAAEQALEERPEGLVRSVVGLHPLNENSVLAQLAYIRAERISRPGPTAVKAQRELALTRDLEPLGLVP